MGEYMCTWKHRFGSNELKIILYSLRCNGEMVHRLGRNFTLMNRIEMQFNKFSVYLYTWVILKGGVPRVVTRSWAKVNTLFYYRPYYSIQWTWRLLIFLYLTFQKGGWNIFTSMLLHAPTLDRVSTHSHNIWTKNNKVKENLKIIEIFFDVNTDINLYDC